MVGESITRICPNCQTENTQIVSVIYSIDREHYVTGMHCSSCDTDLCKEDKRIIKDAR